VGAAAGAAGGAAPGPALGPVPDFAAGAVTGFAGGVASPVPWSVPACAAVVDADGADADEADVGSDAVPGAMVIISSRSWHCSPRTAWACAAGRVSGSSLGPAARDTPCATPPRPGRPWRMRRRPHAPHPVGRKPAQRMNYASPPPVVRPARTLVRWKSSRFALSARQGVARGNPVRVRNCPAAVSGNERRHTHWAPDGHGKRRPVGAGP
jgi:hypothetical protein